MKNLNIVLLFLSIISKTFAQTTQGETRVSLDGYWKFQTDPLSIGDEKQWFLPNLDDKHWANLSIEALEK